MKKEPSKKTRELVHTTQKKNPRKKVELWSQDEARLGLQPIIRTQWCVKGSKPEALNKTVYEWLYVYGFINPSSGDNFWLILPSVNTELMNLALKEFSDYINPKEEKEIILMIDGAGWHRSKDLQIPKGITLLSLPAYTPELQPVERAWPIYREVISNERIEDMTELTRRIVDRSQFLNANPSVIASQCSFSWINKITNQTI